LVFEAEEVVVKERVEKERVVVKEREVKEREE